MKKTFILSLFIIAALFGGKVSAQGPFIFYEDFEDTTHYSFILIGAPTGADTTWIDFDADGIPDGSTAGTRAGEWFLSLGFANVDSTTTVMASNSWTNDATTPVQNYLILPPITVTANDGMLYWKSASFQTPRYLDGYKVVVSTTTNDVASFTDTLSVYAEYVSSQVTSTDSSFSAYTFSPGFVAGMDGQFVEWNNDSARFRCQLRPDSASLAAYAGQTIYIAFLADSHDDNLLSIDDIKVTGTGYAPRIPGSWAGTREAEKSLNAIGIFPNPALDRTTLQISIQEADQYSLQITDMLGNLVYAETLGHLNTGLRNITINTQNLPAGSYSVTLQSQTKKATSRLSVLH